MTLAQYLSRAKRKTRDWGELFWDDSDMADAINEGYTDFVRRTHILKKTGIVNLSVLTHTFSLPSDCMLPYRFQFQKSVVDFTTDDMLDVLRGYDWREVTTDSNYIDHVTQEYIGPGSIRIVPYFEDFSGIDYDIDDAHDRIIMSYDGGADTTITIADGTYSGENLATAWATAINTEFGSAATVTYSDTTGQYSLDALTGHTLAITYSGSTAADRLGITVDVTDAQTITTGISVNLTVDYVYTPTALTTSTEPAFNAEFHKALLYYLLWQLAEEEVGNLQDFGIAGYYKSRYMSLVSEAQTLVSGGRGRRARQKVHGPSFV